MTAETQHDFWPDGLPTQAQARARRDHGVASASEHAERVLPEWNRRADMALLVYLTVVDGLPFLCEELGAWARVNTDLPPPPDNRAWGGVIQRAKKARVIEQAGTASAKTSNCSHKCLWRKREVAP